MRGGGRASEIFNERVVGATRRKFVGTIQCIVFPTRIAMYSNSRFRVSCVGFLLESEERVGRGLSIEKSALRFESGGQGVVV